MKPDFLSLLLPDFINYARELNRDWGLLLQNPCSRRICVDVFFEKRPHLKAELHQVGQVTFHFYQYLESILDDVILSIQAKSAQ